MKIAKLRDWNIYLNVDWNIWLVGVSWSSVPAAWHDVGVYFGPVNFQLERYERHMHASDAFDDFSNGFDDK